VAWVADGQVLAGGNAFVNELIRHGCVDDQPAHGGATLTGGTGGGRCNAAQGKIQVGRWGDDRGVVATEFQQVASETRGNDRGDLLGGAGRTGGRNQIYVRVFQNCIGCIWGYHRD